MQNHCSISIISKLSFDKGCLDYILNVYSHHKHQHNHVSRVNRVKCFMFHLTPKQKWVYSHIATQQHHLSQVHINFLFSSAVRSAYFFVLWVEGWRSTRVQIWQSLICSVSICKDDSELIFPEGCLRCSVSRAAGRHAGHCLSFSVYSTGLQQVWSFQH